MGYSGQRRVGDFLTTVAGRNGERTGLLGAEGRTAVYSQDRTVSPASREEKTCLLGT